MRSTEKPFRWSIPAGSRTEWSCLHAMWPWTITTAGASAASPGTYQPLISIPASRLGNETVSGAGMNHGEGSKSGGFGTRKPAGELATWLGGQPPGTLVSRSYTIALAPTYAPAPTIAATPAPIAIRLSIVPPDARDDPASPLCVCALY